MPKHVTQCIYTEYFQPDDYIMACNRAIPYVANTVFFNAVQIFTMNLNQRYIMIEFLPLDISVGNI